MITNYPNKVELKDLTLGYSSNGKVTAWITDFPKVVAQAETQEKKFWIRLIYIYNKLKF